MSKLYVNSSNRCIRRESPSEPYGYWREEYEFSLNGISLSDDNGYGEEFEVPFDIDAGDEVYVLYMIYSSGDSFGHSEGNSEIIWIFKDKNVAHKAHGVYSNAVEHTDGYFPSIEVEVDGGETLKLSNPASGYFENCSTIELETFVVGE